MWIGLNDVVLGVKGVELELSFAQLSIPTEYYFFLIKKTNILK